MPRSTDLLAQVEAEPIIASATFTLRDGEVDRYSALRFLMVMGGTGAGRIDVDWQLPNGTSIQAAAEQITLASDYAEIPVRSGRALITIIETGGANPIAPTGTVVGVVAT